MGLTSSTILQVFFFGVSKNCFLFDRLLRNTVVGCEFVNVLYVADSDSLFYIMLEKYLQIVEGEVEPTK